MNAIALFDRRKVAAAEWLEALGAELDWSETRLAAAQRSYDTVGAWLAECRHPWLNGARIVAHGSVALGTAITPINREPADVDAMICLPAVPTGTPPSDVKAVVGERLAEHAVYRAMLEEKGRCWRLVYADEQFHLDLTPGVPHLAPPAVLVPDKPLQTWLPSNPEGFRDWFAVRAALAPRPAMARLEKRAEVEPLPLHTGPRGFLRRLVQILKRHRDRRFSDSTIADLRPISIVLTTLASHAYELEIRAARNEGDFELALAVVDAMPYFVGRGADPAERYRIENPTVTGENFADKWNHDPRLPQAFFAWHAQARSDLAALGELAGEDVLAEHINTAFGPGVGSAIAKARIARWTAARSAGRIAFASGTGLSVAPAGGATVRPNTFFGR